MDKMTAHYVRLANSNKTLSFDREKPLSFQRQKIGEKYRELLKMPEERENVPVRVEYERQDAEDYDEIRFLMETEPDFWVPAHLMLPKDRNKGEKLPLVICLQGHSTGMHISMGRFLYPGDEASKSRDGDYALQAVKRGFAAVAMEQRGFGEQKTGVKGGAMCHQIAMQSLMVGHTLLGERIHDIRCLVKALEQFEAVDTGRLAVMGTSGGGTASYHAAAVIPELKAVLDSCSFNRYDASIMSLYHCACNYIPGIARYMEMEDLAVLIAPRPLLIFQGREDDIFPLESAQSAFETVKEIYRAAGAAQNCQMVIGECGHRFSAKDTWPIFEKMIMM
ncbi:MAG: acetylxylan esterase [Lachnospiraceae bacterium]|nr:acetylxylan esterase [Lachnospiraceae bacterium]